MSARWARDASYPETPGGGERGSARHLWASIPRVTDTAWWVVYALLIAAFVAVMQFFI